MQQGNIDIISEALKDIKKDTMGRFLLNKFPERLTDATTYADLNQILEESGSPACTDGKNVYISKRIMEEMLNKEYKRYDTTRISGDIDQYWKAMPVGDPKGLTEARKVSEAKDIILHELTHALNEHSKLIVAAKNKSEAYQRKLQVACEIQANSGILGRHYALNPTQQLRGVTNKRFHPETIGCYTLKSIMNKIKLSEDDKRGGGATQSMKNMEKAMKATGEYEKTEREVGAKNGDDEIERIAGRGKRADESEMCGLANDNQIVGEMSKEGVKRVKELLLASLTDEMKYDPASDTVIYNNVKKRVSRQTYARPSKRIGSYGSERCAVLRKGTKYERVIEPDKSKTLTVLAVDRSGSMTNNQQNVARLTDDLLKQVKEVAEKNNIKVNYERLMATMHDTRATKLVSITSQEWQNAMRHYEADGGNDFDCVLARIENDIDLRDYDAVTVINVSDGLDCFRYEHESDEIGRLTEQGKLKWVDAIISRDQQWIDEAGKCLREDKLDIREQVVVAA